MNKTINFLALKAFGDNLITLSLLSNINKEINILGTKHTKNIADLINFNQNIDIVFQDIPAFYDIKKQGLFKAIKDILYLRKYLKNNNIKNLVFETNDWRVKVLTFGLKIKVYYPDTNKDIYISRKNLIERLCNTNINLAINYPKNQNIKNILINPTTRESFRNTSFDNLSTIINLLHPKYHITLIDYEEKYQMFKNEVDYYLINTTLDDVSNLMRQTDFYIGGDSFLVHLAYYFNKPYFIIFNRENDDFLPPNAIDDCYIKTTNITNFEREISNKFSQLNVL